MLCAASFTNGWVDVMFFMKVMICLQSIQWSIGGISSPPCSLAIYSQLGDASYCNFATALILLLMSTCSCLACWGVSQVMPDRWLVSEFTNVPSARFQSSSALPPIWISHSFWEILSFISWTR